MFRLARRSVLAHKLRLTLTAIAIVLGVAFVSGTYVFTDSIRASFEDLFGDVNANVDLYVRGTTEFGTLAGDIDEEIVAAVAAVPGVDLAVPSVEGIAQLVDANGDPIGGTGPPTLGFSYLPEGEAQSPLTTSAGRPPNADGEVMIDAFSAEANEFAVGDVLPVILPIGTEDFEIVGIATFGDADNLLGATLAIFEFETAQRVFGLDGKVSSVSINIDAGADLLTTQAGIAEVLPERVEVVTSDTETEDVLAEVDEGLGFINTILLVIAGVAVFVGAFIIQNTFRIIVAQRTRELAMLRAVGATGRQVTGMVAIEAFIVSLVASLIGVGVGILFAQGIKGAFGAFGFGLPGGPLTIQPRTIVVGLAVGVVVTLVSALIPARKAARVPPVAALRDVQRPTKGLGRRALVGAGVTGIGVVLLAVGLIADVDNALALVGFGALVGFVGVSILAPLVARVFARYVGSPLPRFFGITGRLAQENAMRRPRRTAATASALMIGVALVSVLAVFSASAKAGVAKVFEEDFETDLQIRNAAFADPRQAGLPPALTDDIRALDETGAVARVRVGEYRLGEERPTEFLLGVDGALDDVVNLDLVEGSYEDFTTGTALVFEDEAVDEGLGVGDTYVAEVPSGEVLDLPIVGVFAGDGLGVPLLVTLDTYESSIAFNLDRFVFIQAADGVAQDQLRAAVDAVAESYPSADVTNTQELISDIEAQIDGLLNLLIVLLGFAIVIALLGIVNTLVLSISERQREIGLLRAVGMERRQVKRMIRWEAVLIAVFGGVLGNVVGVLLGIAVVLAVGQGLSLAIPNGQLITYLVAAAIGGVLAAILPARRGAKTNVLEAISYE